MSGRLRSFANLSQFFLFNPTWGQQEGQESRRLIYYYNFRPETDSCVEATCAFEMDAENMFDCSKDEFNNVVNLVGLCGALITFMKNFGDKEGKLDRCALPILSRDSFDCRS